MSFLDDALSPFRYFDLTYFYDQYAWLIDGIIFFSIFLGLSRHAFGKRFDPRSANAISVAFSFALTLGLLLAEYQFNFNIKSFGGLAIGAILLITGFFMYSLSRTTGIERVSSFCLSYFLIYSSIASMYPNLFDFIATKAKWLNGILGIIWLISIFMLLKAIAHFFSSRHRKGLLEKPLKEDIHIEEKEIAVVKDLKRKISDISELETALHAIESIIEQNDNLGPDELERIRRYLTVISKRESIFRQDYDRTLRGLKRLGEIDKRRLDRLINELPTIPDNLKKEKETEIQIERRKLEYETTIVTIQQNLDQEIKVFNSHITASYERIRVSRRDTLTCLGNAKTSLQNLRKLIHDVKRLERELIDLNKLQKDTLKGERRKRRRK